MATTALVLFTSLKIEQGAFQEAIQPAIKALDIAENFFGPGHPYVATAINNLAYINSVSDFPIFDESITSVSLEALAESNPVYGINWSGRFSMGNYFPSNGDSFWLYKADLALHFQISENFVFVPFFGINLATDDLADAVVVAVRHVQGLAAGVPGDVRRVVKARRGRRAAW